MSRRDTDGSFEEAFRDLFPRAEALARRLLGSDTAAEDVAAEAMARAYVSWSRLRSPSHRLAWVLRVTTNLAIDSLKHRPRRSMLGISRDPAEEAAVRLALVDALRSLPRRQREVIVLRYFSDLPEADIASSLGISTGAVKTHLHRATTSLRRSMGDHAPATQLP